MSDCSQLHGSTSKGTQELTVSAKQKHNPLMDHNIDFLSSRALTIQQPLETYSNQEGKLHCTLHGFNNAWAEGGNNTGWKDMENCCVSGSRRKHAKLQSVISSSLSLSRTPGCPAGSLHQVTHKRQMNGNQTTRMNLHQINVDS